MAQTWDIDTIVPATTSPSADIQKIIDGFNALRSTFSGTAEPAVADQVAYMLWADTTTGLLKQRNAANSAWITLGTMASTNLGLISAAGANLTGGVNFAKSTVASATTPDIFATTVGNVVDYTGALTATGFTAAPVAGALRLLRCAGASSFTAGANVLIDGVPSGGTVTMAANDKVLVFAFTTTQFVLTLLRDTIPSVVLTDAATVAVDMAVGNGDFTVTLGGNRTLGAPTNTSDNLSGKIAITQDGTGSRTLAYNAVWKFPGGTVPTLTTTAAAVDTLFYTVRSSTLIDAVLQKGWA
jgi:hypothetical protein